MKKLLTDYQNGNYHVLLFEDGTKVRMTNAEKFIPEFAENIDLKITNFCDAGCGYCHERSTTNGYHGDLWSLPAFSSGQEVAIGGGNPLDHPYLEQFLLELKGQKVYPNLTVNQVHFEIPYYQDMLQRFVDKGLVYGIGVSLMRASAELVEMINRFPNVVVHTINRIHTPEKLSPLYDNGIKILVLGYKNWGRGKEYTPRGSDLGDFIPELRSRFKIVSFDNLAIEQMNPKRFLSESEWETFFMGEDGNYTFYIDAVEQVYAMNSTSPNRFPIGQKTVMEMFDSLH